MPFATQSRENILRDGRVDLMMKLVFLSWALAVGLVQAVPGSDCLCRPACDGTMMPVPQAPRGCCDEEAPPAPQPCSCLHQSPSGPTALEATAPPSIVPVAVDAPEVQDHVVFPLRAAPCPHFRRPDLPRGAPLYLINSVLLI